MAAAVTENAYETSLAVLQSRLGLNPTQAGFEKYEGVRTVRGVLCEDVAWTCAWSGHVVHAKQIRYVQQERIATLVGVHQQRGNILVVS